MYAFTYTKTLLCAFCLLGLSDRKYLPHSATKNKLVLLESVPFLLIWAVQVQGLATSLHFRRGGKPNIADFNQVLAVSSMGPIPKDSTKRAKKVLSSGILLCSHFCYSSLSIYTLDKYQTIFLYPKYSVHLP